MEGDNKLGEGVYKGGGGDFPGSGRENKHIFGQCWTSPYSMPQGKTVKFGPSLDQSYKTLYLMIRCKVCVKFEHLSMMGHNRIKP